jgi:hypothetical protein
MIENASMGGDGDGREIPTRKACLLMAQKRIEDLPARARTEQRRKLGHALLARKFIREAKRARGDLGFDARQVDAGGRRFVSCGIQGSVGGSADPRCECRIGSERVPACITPPVIDLRPILILPRLLT